MDPFWPAARAALSPSLSSSSLGDLAASARRVALEPWRRSYRRFLMRDATFTFALAVLFASGVSAARCGVIAAVLLWGVATQLFLFWLPVGRRRKELVFSASELTIVFSWYCASAATGGLQSPFLVVSLAVLPLSFLLGGWTGFAKAEVAMNLAGIAVLGLLPQALWGTEVRAAAHGAIVAVFVVCVTWTTVYYFGVLARVATESIGEAARAREEVTRQAISRARELEQVGARLSHELKNPLSAIKTLVQISARTAPEGVARERLQMVEGAVLRMQQIIHDQLSFSRPLEKLQPKELLLSVVVDEVLALVGGRATELRIDLRRRGDARALADPRQLRDALLNLLVNSIDASAPGGSVEVELEQRAESARLVVRDSGSGMSEETLSRIGTPFFTTRPSGTGLGVALARAAFVNHGGALEYESRQGEGTTATATIPIRAARRSDGTRAGGG